MAVIPPRGTQMGPGQLQQDGNLATKELRSLFTQESRAVSLADARTWIKAELTEQAHLDQLVLDRAAAIEAEAQGLRKREALRQLMASDPCRSSWE
jgi:hypothetical protein